VASKKSSRPNVVAVVGPTGSGKTALAVKLVRRFGGVIISADSRQLYRGMDVGTAKATHEEQHAAKHYLIDVINPSQRYSAGRFQREAYRLVKKLFAQKPDEPILIVGGTYLYVDAVLKGLDFAETTRSPKVRARLEKLTLQQLQRELRKRDPLTAHTIDMHNPRRLIRALEVVLSTGKSFYGARASTPPDWNILWLGIKVPQATLDRNNAKRIDRMMRAGWVQEVKRLRKRYPKSAAGFLAHGYREVIDYIEGNRTLPQTKKQIAINTRHHTKRQMAWFKKNPAIKWLGPRDINKAAKLTARLLKNSHR